MKPWALQGQLRITGTEVTPIWESHLLERNCYYNLINCVCSMMKLKGKFVFPAFSILLPQWQRGQQSWVLQRNSVPSGQEGVSITGQLTFSVVMNTSSFILTHRCNTHLSCGDCHTSPTYKQRWDSNKLHSGFVAYIIHALMISPHTYLSEDPPNQCVPSHVSPWLCAAGWCAFPTALSI